MSSPVLLEFPAREEFYGHHVNIVGYRRAGTFLHYHTFYEIMYIVKGEGTHLLNGKEFALQPGDLIFLKPQDCHDFGVTGGQRLYFANISFQSELWKTYCELIKIDPEAPSGVGRTAVHVPELLRPECEHTFTTFINQHFERPSRANLVCFWSQMLPFLQREYIEDLAVYESMPPWLKRACYAMQDPETMVLGMSKFTQLSGVSEGHLLRVLKEHTGKTTTQFINSMRIKRAATLLVTTDLDITDVALNCGFENLSYFYRIFESHYSCTPRVYRLQCARRRLAEGMFFGPD